MEPCITVIVASYQRYDHIPIMIHAFLTQTTPNWRMVIVHDGPDETHKNVVEPYTKKYPNITYHQSETRKNDWGHSLRSWALQNCVETDWVLITNDDNYYTPNFLAECYSIIESKPKTEMVLYDCILNTTAINTKPIKNPYSTHFSFTNTKYIDMGSFITKSSIAKTVGFNSTIFEADAKFISDIKKTYPKLNIIKINQTLFVHN